MDATEIIEFSADDLRTQAEKNPEFGRDLVTRMARVLLQRLQATRIKLQEFSDSGVGRRLDAHWGDLDDAHEPFTDPAR